MFRFLKYASHILLSLIIPGTAFSADTVIFKSLSGQIQEYLHVNAPELKVDKLSDPVTDGAIIDKRHHHILYEDKTIRVIEVIINPLEDETFHTHYRSAIMYVDSPANIDLYADYNHPTVMTIQIRDPKPRISVIPFEELHKLKSVDANKRYHAFRIEIKANIVSLPNFRTISNGILHIIEAEVNAQR